ncbi:MAG: hypothetical protein ACJA1I_002485, partial [Zhongshania marina]
TTQNEEETAEIINLQEARLGETFRFNRIFAIT